MIDARAGSTLTLWTYKEGLLSRMAHDLQFAATGWRAALDVEGERARIEVVVPVAGLRLQGQVSGGAVVPMSAKDAREIEGNLAGRDVLDAAAHPDLRWRGEAPLAALRAGPARRIEGRLTLRGVERPLPLEVTVRPDGDGIVAAGEVRLRQSSFGIKPFSAVFGALRVQDEVRVGWSIAWAKDGPAPP